MCEPFGAMLPQKSLSNQKRAKRFALRFADPPSPACPDQPVAKRGRKPRSTWQVSEHHTHASFVKLVKPGIQVLRVFPKVGIRPHNGCRSPRPGGGRDNDAVRDSLLRPLTEEFPQPVYVIVEVDLSLWLIVTVARAGRGCGGRWGRSNRMDGHIWKDRQDVSLGHGARPEDVNFVPGDSDYRRLEANLAGPAVEVGCRCRSKTPTGHLHGRWAWLARPVGAWRGNRDAGGLKESLRTRMCRYPDCHGVQTGGHDSRKFRARWKNDG